MESLQIRKATAEDQKWFAKLFDANKNILGNVSGGTVFYRWLKGGNAREHIAVIPEFAFAHWLVRKDGTRVLYEIAVHETMKRRGIGRLFLDHIGTPMELKTDAENAESNRFYQALGFIKLGYKATSAGKRVAIYQKF